MGDRRLEASELSPDKTKSYTIPTERIDPYDYEALPALVMAVVGRFPKGRRENVWSMRNGFLIRNKPFTQLNTHVSLPLLIPYPLWLTISEHG
jgi:hypothetical protein